MRRAAEEFGQLVYGIHPVQELLAARAGEVERIFVAREASGAVGRLLREARQRGVPVTHLPRELLERKLGARARHQGIAAQVAPRRYEDSEELCRELAERPGAILVMAEGVEDPRNLGAILRTCAATGVDGILLGVERTAGLTPAAVKSSAGTVERLRVAREPRPGPRLEALERTGFHTLALDARGDVPWDRLDLRDRFVCVAGGEERGLRPGLLRACRSRVALPLAPGVNSLNVAVAVGVLLYEARRQRRASRGQG